MHWGNSCARQGAEYAVSKGSQGDDGERGRGHLLAEDQPKPTEARARVRCGHLRPQQPRSTRLRLAKLFLACAYEWGAAAASIAPSTGTLCAAGNVPRPCQLDRPSEDTVGMPASCLGGYKEWLVESTTLSSPLHSSSPLLFRWSPPLHRRIQSPTTPPVALWSPFPAHSDHSTAAVIAPVAFVTFSSALVLCDLTSDT